MTGQLHFYVGEPHVTLLTVFVYGGLDVLSSILGLEAVLIKCFWRGQHNIEVLMSSLVVLGITTCSSCLARGFTDWAKLCLG